MVCTLPGVRTQNADHWNEIIGGETFLPRLTKANRGNDRSLSG